MDGLRSVFNERSRYLCRRYMSLLRFLEPDKLTRAGIVQNDHLSERSRRILLEFTIDNFWDFCQNGVVFTIETESDANTCYWGPGIVIKNWWINVYNDARSTHVDRRLDECFHLLATNCRIRDTDTMNSINGIDDEDIWNAQFVAGSRLLQCLEKALSNSSLSDSGADTLRALLLILCLTMFVVICSPGKPYLVSFLYIRVRRQLMRAGFRS